MANPEHPVSVLVDREVLPGKKAEFEEALKGIIDASQKFPGALGTDVILPEEECQFHYRVIFRFQTMAQLKAWEKSAERLKWLKIIDLLTQAPTELQVITGLETWFSLPRAKQIIPPPRYKMALVTWMAITPLLILFNLITQPLLGPIPIVFRIMISTPIIVLIMTYLLMPLMVKIFAKWLYPKQC